MRMSRLFGRTLRDVPSGTEVAGHGLLLRAGFVRQLAAGVFSYLPLAKRSMDKVQNILREEMDACGGQEVSMPVVHPAGVWERSGRYAAVGPELVKLQDRRGRAMVLAMTHEEVVAGWSRARWILTSSCRGSSTSCRQSSRTTRGRGPA